MNLEALQLLERRLYLQHVTLQRILRCDEPLGRRAEMILHVAADSRLIDAETGGEDGVARAEGQCGDNFAAMRGRADGAGSWHRRIMAELRYRCTTASPRVTQVTSLSHFVHARAQ